MMRRCTGTLVLTAVLAASVAGPSVAAPYSRRVLLDLDREVSGLLDAYLEAIPACPPDEGDRVRPWLLDVAWLRASATLERAEGVDPSLMGPGFPAEEWTVWIDLSRDCLETFREIQVAYHSDVLPDSATCVALEDELLMRDSLWSARERILVELLAEEGYR